MVASSIGRYSGGAWVDDARSQFFGDADLPRRARSNLFTSDEAFRQPTMDRGSIHAQDLRGLGMVTTSPCGGSAGRLKTRDVTIAAQTADLIGGKAFPARRPSPLTIQDAGYHLVGIERRQTG